MLYIIFNPHAGRGRAARQETAIRSALAAAELEFEFVKTERVDHARELAAHAAEQDRYSAIVGAGGDGTINEIVNGMLGSALPLGIIPLGTGNDFVKVIDLPPDRPALAAQKLRDGVAGPIDIGVANGRAFINGLGCGMDAQVTVESQRPTRLHGFAVYLVALVRALRHYTSPVMRVRFGNEVIEQRTLFAAIGNGQCQGGGFWLTPDAKIDDGLLDLCVCHHLQLHEIARHLPKVLRGTHTRIKPVRMARVAGVEIEALAPVPFHVDGELISTGIQQVEVTVKPGAINLIS